MENSVKKSTEASQSMLKVCEYVKGLRKKRYNTHKESDCVPTMTARRWRTVRIVSLNKAAGVAH